MSFQIMLKTHLAALQGRDLPTFLSTLTAGPDLSLISPNGTLIATRADVVRFMEGWFADPDWRMEYEVLRVVETAAMGFAILLVDYTDLDSTGQPYALRYYLQLIFALEDGQWRLVHDQNTIIKPPA